MTHPTHRFFRAALAVACAGMLLGGCQKAAEVASEKAIEKTIESQMKEGGAKEAKVDLTNGTVKATTVDKDGKTQNFELGNASAVTEADIGLPFYPGATVDSQHVTKLVTNDDMAAMMPLTTSDPVDKVAAFYRERMKAKSAGLQFMDMAQGEGSQVLMLIDEAKGESTQVMVSAGKNGEPSTVMLTFSRKKKG